MADEHDNHSNTTVDSGSSGNGSDSYEKVCFLCRRPESVTGPMIGLPNDIHICSDCMQKSFDAMKNSNINYKDLMNLTSANVIDLSTLYGQVPQNQKIKKKEPKKKEPAKALDIKDIPAPHKILHPDS